MKSQARWPSYVVGLIIHLMTLGLIAAADSALALPWGKDKKRPVCEQILLGRDGGTPGGRVYSQGSIDARSILRMSKKEYRDRVLAESIPMDSLIVVDQLPLDVDLPMVAGVIVSKPLGVEGSHIEMQAVKMGLPLAFVDGVMDRADILEWANKKQPVRVKAAKHVIIEEISSYRLKPLLKSAVLPRALSRRKVKVVGPAEAEGEKIEHVGGKFMHLARISQTPMRSEVPTLFGMTSGFYELFMDTSLVDGVKLREYVSSRMRSIQMSLDDEAIKATLAEIREAIFKAQAKNFLRVLENQLLDVHIPKDMKVSVRTSNEIEDHIGAGVFQSAVAVDVSLDSMNKALREVWAAMYTYRSYMIRRYWGLQEENLSMPVMVHRYVDGEILSGTASFELDKQAIKMRVQLVYGENNKATNPVENGRSDTLTMIEYDGEVLLEDAPFGLDPRVESALRQLFLDLRDIARFDFVELQYAPMAVDIEFLLNKRHEAVLLQYKRRHPRETVLSLLSGHLKLSSLELKVNRAASDSPEGLKLALKRNAIEYLAGQNLEEGFHREDLRRCALVEVDGALRIVTWEGRAHQEIERLLPLINKKLKWIAGGYLEVNTRGKMYFWPEARQSFWRKKLIPEEVRQALRNEVGFSPDLLKRVKFVAIFDNEHNEPVGTFTP